MFSLNVYAMHQRTCEILLAWSLSAKRGYHSFAVLNYLSNQQNYITIINNQQVKIYTIL